MAGRFARIISARNTKNLRKPEAPAENKTNEQVTGCQKSASMDLDFISPDNLYKKKSGRKCKEEV